MREHKIEAIVHICGMAELSEEDRELFAGWNAAKAEKDFAKADEFRAKLMERGLL